MAQDQLSLAQRERAAQAVSSKPEPSVELTHKPSTRCRSPAKGGNAESRAKCASAAGRKLKPFQQSPRRIHSLWHRKSTRALGSSASLRQALATLPPRSTRKTTQKGKAAGVQRSCVAYRCQHLQGTANASKAAKAQMYATLGSPFTRGFAEPKSHTLRACV